MAMVKQYINRRKLIQDYKKGYSLRKLAEIHYSNRTTIREKLIEYGVYDNSTISEKIGKEELAVLIQKFSVVEIAEIYKVHHSSIYRLIKKYKLKVGN